MLKSLEYSRILYIIIHIIAHHGIMGRRLGATFSGHNHLDNSNSESSALQGSPADDLNEPKLYINDENQPPTIIQTTAEDSLSEKQYNRSTDSMVRHKGVPSKPAYSNSHNEATERGYNFLEASVRGKVREKDSIYDTHIANLDLGDYSAAQTIPDYRPIGSRPLTVNSSGDKNIAANSRGVRQSKNRRKGKIRLAGSKTTDSHSGYFRQCPRLAARTDVTFNCTRGRNVGSICKLSCPDGFAPNGRSTRRCEPRKHRKSKKRHRKTGARWTGKKDDFQCLPICKHLKNPENGDKMCDILNETRGKVRKCTTKCNRGYKIVGNPQNFCKRNGKWSSLPATCILASSSMIQARKKRFEFREHQSLPCGESFGLTSFTRDGIVYLVAGDKTQGLVNVFRWGDGQFEESPFQTLLFPSPDAVEVVSSRGGTIWLIVGGAGPSIMYRMGPAGKFQRSHVTSVQMGTHGGAVADAIAFAELRGEFYRCYGRNRRETPVIVVHKLQGRHTAGGEIFKRIMRKKLPGERVEQCSMFTEGNSLYAVATLHKRDGRGRLMIGHITRNRMKIVNVVSGRHLYQITDSHGFSINGDRYIAVSQSVKNGQCVVYKRHWETTPSGETG